MLPLTVYLSSFTISCLLGTSTVTKRLKEGKTLFMLGAVIGLFNSAAFFFPVPFPRVSLFLMSILLGLAQSILLICSLSCTATLINLNTVSSFIADFGEICSAALSFGFKNHKSMQSAKNHPYHFIAKSVVVPGSRLSLLHLPL